MAKNKPVTKTIEDGYFHISNSGLTFRLLEKATPSSREGNGPSITWEIEIRLGAFGHGVSFRFPLMANMAEYFANVFGRLHTRMVELRMSGLYETVNGESPHGGVKNVEVSVAGGLKFDDILDAEGHPDVACWHGAGQDANGSYSSITYRLPGGDPQGEGSELESQWKARMARLRELKAPLGAINTSGGSYRLLALDEDLLQNVREMAWTDEWTEGPTRGAKAKQLIGNYFECHPDCFKLYSPGFSEAKRRLVLSRLGIVDQELIAECLQIKLEGQATS